MALEEKTIIKGAALRDLRREPNEGVARSLWDGVKTDGTPGPSD